MGLVPALPVEITWRCVLGAVALAFGPLLVVAATAFRKRLKRAQQILEEPTEEACANTVRAAAGQAEHVTEVPHSVPTTAAKLRKGKPVVTADAVATYAELSAMARETAANIDYRRLLGDGCEVRLDYVCTGCRCKKTKQPTKCTTFKNCFDHVTSAKCAATGMPGPYELIVDRCDAVDGDRTEVTRARLVFDGDRKENALRLHNSLCRILTSFDAATATATASGSRITLLSVRCDSIGPRRPTSPVPAHSKTTVGPAYAPPQHGVWQPCGVLGGAYPVPPMVSAFPAAPCPVPSWCMPPHGVPLQPFTVHVLPPQGM